LLVSKYFNVRHSSFFFLRELTRTSATGSSLHI
jgi:hypothetical protein